MAIEPAPAPAGQAQPEPTPGAVPGAVPDPVAAPTPAPENTPFGAVDAELQAYIDNKKWTSPADAINAYKNLEGFRGVPEDRLLKLPTDQADPEGMGEVWDRLGRPEAADKYTLALPEEMKDSVYDHMATAAHTAGLTDAQFQGMQKEFAAAAETLQQQRNEAVAADLETWKASNQQDFSNVQQLMNAAQITPDEMAAALSGDSAAFYGTLAKVASRMGERPAAGLDSSGGGKFGMTPEQAQQKIAAMNADPAFQARLNSDDAKVRLAAAAERRPFMQVANPGTGTPSELDVANQRIAQLQAELRGNQRGTL